MKVKDGKGDEYEDMMRYAKNHSESTLGISRWTTLGISRWTT